MSTDISALRGQVEILRWCKTKRAELKELEDNAKAAIQDTLDGDDIGTVDGEPVVTWKSHKRTALDQTALKNEDPETYALYTKTTEVRRFEVCD